MEVCLRLLSCDFRMAFNRIKGPEDSPAIAKCFKQVDNKQNTHAGIEFDNTLKSQSVPLELLDQQERYESFPSHSMRNTPQ